ncbi:MAG: hypothetical protein E6I16_13685 [Chloroflexi bacterium]|nr:MAG: hypothetical protein E6I16_13685 [Chloroflexota bacterium]
MRPTPHRRPATATVLLWLWTTLLLLVTAGACLIPVAIVRTAQHDTTPEAGVGYLFLLIFFVTLVAPVPLLAGGLWLAGYAFWRSHMTAAGRPVGWRRSKVITYVLLAVLSVYVLSITACNAWLNS